jgi:hypothetical protein
LLAANVGEKESGFKRKGVVAASTMVTVNKAKASPELRIRLAEDNRGRLGSASTMDASIKKFAILATEKYRCWHDTRDI